MICQTGTNAFTIGLAPMEGVSDFPMRLWLWLVSQPAYMTTPFLRATQSYPHRELDPAFAPELLASLKTAPYKLTPQIMASDAAHFRRAAELFLQHADFVELNAGCPAPTSTGRGAGSSLLRDVDAWRQFLVELCTGLGGERVAVKMRTGFDDEREFMPLLAAIADLPLRRLTVHARTRADRYLGYSRWPLIEVAARTVTYPVIASGDIVDHASLKALRTMAPGVQGVIIGRGALRQPFVFEELRSGKVMAIHSRLVPAALAVFGLLIEGAARAEVKLWRLVDRGLLEHPPGLAPEAWDNLVMSLSGMLGVMPATPRDYANLPLGRQTLGRMKMLWSYWRSSLNEAYFAPRVLRARTAGDLLAEIEGIGDATGTVQVPRHQSSLDWIYAGAKKPQLELGFCSP